MENDADLTFSNLQQFQELFIQKDFIIILFLITGADLGISKGEYNDCRRHDLSWGVRGMPPRKL